MSYLEKEIICRLKDFGYVCNIPIEDVVAYINEANEGDTSFYSVTQWIEDTAKNYPEEVFPRISAIKKAVSYLTEQKGYCFVETGRSLTIDDYVGHLDSDEFYEAVGYKFSLEELLESLMEYFSENEIPKKPI